MAFLLFHLELDVPGAQTEHEVAPGPAQLPGEQGSQPYSFVWAAEAVPATQKKQDPVLFCYCPGPQEEEEKESPSPLHWVSAVALDFKVVLPGGHDLHTSSNGSSWKNPGSHDLHSPTLICPVYGCVVPLPQVTQESCPSLG